MYLLFPLCEQRYCRSVQTEVSKEKMRHNTVCKCVNVCVNVNVCVCECGCVWMYVWVCVCEGAGVGCMNASHYKSTGGPQGRETPKPNPQISHRNLHTMGLAVLVNTLSSKSSAQLTSQVTSQGQGREWRDSPGVGCLLLDVFRQSLWPSSFWKVNKYQGGPEVGTELGTWEQKTGVEMWTNESRITITTNELLSTECL